MSDPFRVKHPYAKPGRLRRRRKIDGAFQRSYLFGGKKLGRHRRALRHKADERRREFGGHTLESTRLARETRGGQPIIRRIYAKHLAGEFRGDVRDPTVKRARRIEQ